MTADIDHRGTKARLTTDHPAARDGIPVLIVGGIAHATADVMVCAGRTMTCAAFVREWFTAQVHAHTTRTALRHAFVDRIPEERRPPQ